MDNNRLSIKKYSYGYFLYIDGKQWMCYSDRTHIERKQLTSHHYLGEGHCICTGLGFGIREDWLLKKDNITKLTIIEKYKDVIKYHKEMGSSFLSDKRVEIINEDADEFKGECDTLLLDHYEHTPTKEIIKSVQKVQKNIKSKKMWFWPIERILCKDKEGLPIDLYNKFKSEYGLSTLPDLSEEEINFFCSSFFNFKKY